MYRFALPARQANRDYFRRLGNRKWATADLADLVLWRLAYPCPRVWSGAKGTHLVKVRARRWDLAGRLGWGGVGNIQAGRRVSKYFVLWQAADPSQAFGLAGWP